MAKTFVILNPAAGSVKDVDALVERIRILPDAEVCITANAGEVMQFTKAALGKGCEMVVAAGGDGTLNEVVNGLREDASAIVLGLIPLGTGNDFARTLDLPREVDEAIALLLAGHTRPIDLVRVTSDEIRYFVNVSTGGFSVSFLRSDAWRKITRTRNSRLGQCFRALSRYRRQHVFSGQLR